MESLNHNKNEQNINESILVEYDRNKYLAQTFGGF